MDRGTLIILLVVAGVLLLSVLSGFKTVPDGSKGTVYRFRRGPQRVESGRTYVLPGVDDFVVEPEEQHGVVGVSGNAVTSDRRVVHVQLQVRFKAHSDGMSDATDFAQRQAAAHLHLVIASMTLVEARRDHGRIRDEMSVALNRLTQGLAREIAVEVRATEAEHTEPDRRVRSRVYSRDGKTFRSTLSAEEVVRRVEEAPDDTFVQLRIIVPSPMVGPSRSCITSHT